MTLIAMIAAWLTVAPPPVVAPSFDVAAAATLAEVVDVSAVAVSDASGSYETTTAVDAEYDWVVVVYE